MQAKQKIEQLIGESVDQMLGDSKPIGEIKLEHPSEESHGDYSTNVALVAGGGMELAEKIADRLREMRDLGEVVEKVEAVKPGFINFWLSQEYLLKHLTPASQGSTLQGWALQGKKVMVEFTDPNPFKEFHIGHIFTNTVGEALARLFESQGADVKRANYQGDVGLHVAKAVWGIQRELKSQNLEFKDLEEQSLEERTRFLGRAYAIGAVAYDEDEQAKEEIKKLNKEIYDLIPGKSASKGPSFMNLQKIYEKGREWSLEAFEKIYARLGTKFDFYYFERETGKVGEEYVRSHVADGVFVEDEGAIIFQGEQHGLHNRVFINSLGLPTYEAKDLGLAETKYKDFPYDESYIVTGNEIKDYFKVIIKALSLINPDLGAKTNHISHGMLRLPEGKMSSRTGKVITGEWLLDEAKKKLLADYPEMEDETADMVAVGAIKCALLKSTIGSDVIFDFDKSLSFDGDSGPYLQYTYARCMSILSKMDIVSNTENINLKFEFKLKIKNLKLESEEAALLRWLYRFPEIVEEAATNFAPNTVCAYLFELAQRYNTFYNKHRIIANSEQRVANRENKNAKRYELNATSSFRLALTEATANILKTGLDLLGIQAPARM